MDFAIKSRLVGIFNGADRDMEAGADTATEGGAVAEGMSTRIGCGIVIGGLIGSTTAGGCIGSTKTGGCALRRKGISGALVVADSPETAVGGEKVGFVSVATCAQTRNGARIPAATIPTTWHVAVIARIQLLNSKKHVQFAPIWSHVTLSSSS